MRSSLTALLVVWLGSSFVTQAAYADDPATEADAIRAEIAELKESISKLQARVDALEDRLTTLESNREADYPWLREQPFYWDSVAPVPGERERRRELERRLRKQQRSRLLLPIR